MGSTSWGIAGYGDGKNITVDGNRVSFSTNAGGTSKYEYGISATGTSCKVINNIFDECFDTDGIRVGSDSYISGNTINRGDFDVNSHINMVGSNSVCVDNILDSMYVDTDELDSGTIIYDSTEVVERNKNHIKSRQLSFKNLLIPSDREWGYDALADSAYLGLLATDEAGFVGQINIQLGGTVSNINGYMRLYDVLPPGAKLLRVSYDWSAVNINWSGGVVRLWVGIEGNVPPSPPALPLLIEQTDDLSNVSGTLDSFDEDPNLKVGENHFINVNLQGMTATSEAKFITLSNLVIEYTW